MKTAVVSILTLALFACGPASGSGDGLPEDDTNPGDGTGTPGGGGDDSDVMPEVEQAPCQKMDIVFVVDDSASMGEEQTNLGSNFPQFINVLNSFMTSAGDQLDYRIAVTTTGRDVDYTVTVPPPFSQTIPISERGDNGRFRQDCGMSRPWIERNDGTVSDTFACAAQVGTSGPGIEMPLYTLELALNERMNDGSNQGFLREDALLAVVILTDEDDCSRNDNDFDFSGESTCADSPDSLPIDRFLGVLDTATGGRGRWATAIIAGPGPGTCSSNFGDAVEATRLQDFVERTGANAVFSSICEGDLSSALEDALNTFDAACEFFPPVE